jgi:large subunit ribosomal protein L28
VNLQPVKAQVNGASKRMRVCTSCIKTGKVVKG